MNALSCEPRGTAALLVNAEGKYLLHLRDANKPWICDPGTWSIPGGNREGEESSRDAVERELLEETGLCVPLEPFTVVDAHGPDGRTGQIRVYLGAWDGDADALPCPEGIMFRTGGGGPGHRSRGRRTGPRGAHGGRAGTQPMIGLYFRARRWEGTPVVREPDRCASWGWWDCTDLPEPVVPYTRAAIEGIRAGRMYTELGWGP
ncbi:NUDIX domain-containing protein [Streptomyces sp. NPDC096033]|uniref:NUDIX domain-containing protein n=1 Tax=Streptomyces sp. NPDC096033 TaxID=3366071 RepID=UPI0038259628